MVPRWSIDIRTVVAVRPACVAGGLSPTEQFPHQPVDEQGLVVLLAVLEMPVAVELVWRSRRSTRLAAVLLLQRIGVPHASAEHGPTLAVPVGERQAGRRVA